MGVVARVLPDQPLSTLKAYEAAGGGAARGDAARLGPASVIDEIDASGLRGRGGAGFPAGRKWRTVAANHSPELSTTVVVNAAEGEPGSFKDRSILRANPYAVLEGALVAAYAVGADEVIVAVKRTFMTEIERLEAAIAELRDGGWCADVNLSVFAGPNEYLYGEETGLLEAIDGRPPFPRIAPPFRHGVDEVLDATAAADSATASGVELAGPGPDTVAAPTLAGNVETFANVPGIIANGADWFRSVGTEESPGTIACTVTGRTRRHGVGEVAMGTPLREIIETIGGGTDNGRSITAVMSGVANALVPAELLDTPASYEGMAAIGSGLGAAGFIVFDDTTDFAAVAAGVATFLGVESCGQCTPCKRDGLTLSTVLERVTASDATDEDLDTITAALATVADSARCNLALQQQVVIGSLLELFPDDVRAHVDDQVAARDPEPIVPVTDIVDGRAVLDEHELDKQPDWTYDEIDSGKWPAAAALPTVAGGAER